MAIPVPNFIREVLWATANLKEAIRKLEVLTNRTDHYTYTIEDGKITNHRFSHSTTEYDIEFVCTTVESRMSLPWDEGGAGSGGGGSLDPKVDPKKPCPGDPIKNPEIAPQKGASGIKGGMYGCTRFEKDAICGGVKGRKEHSGIDLKASYGDPIYATHDGTARLVTQKKDGKIVGAGHYVEITSIINGETVKILSFHLQKDNRKSGAVKAGDIIGYLGDSGNLKEAIENKDAESHIHIKVNVGSNHVDPNNYLGTTFDFETGKVTQNPDCNN